MDKRSQTIEDLTLALLYLTSWREKGMDENIRRSWKGYDFEALNTLSEKDDISDGRRSKSVYLTPEGIARAKTLLERFGINDREGETSETV